MAQTTGWVCFQSLNDSRRDIVDWLREFRLALVLTAMSALLTGCGGGDGEGGGTGAPPPVVGGMATLTWNPVESDNVVGYVVHYGPASPNSGGSCSYDHTLFVSGNEAVVTGLAYATTYYFAVSSYNGVESACSEEVSKHIPAEA